MENEKCHKCNSVNIYHEEDGVWCYECEEFTFTDDIPLEKSTDNAD